jgi:excisionase family DNA binding protein
MPKLDLADLRVGGITPSYVSVDIAAALMGVSHWTVRRWITSGALPARKLPSGGLRVAVADLEEIGEPVRPDRHATSRKRAGGR